MHEALVTRNDVRGWDERARKLIFHKYNCVLVCHGIHIASGHAKWFREECKDLLFNRYGEDAVRFWIMSLPFKVDYNSSLL